MLIWDSGLLPTIITTSVLWERRCYLISCHQTYSYLLHFQCTRLIGRFVNTTSEVSAANFQIGIAAPGSEVIMKLLTIVNNLVI